MQTVRQMKMIVESKLIQYQVDELMRVFSSAKRYAFNRLSENENPKELIKQLQQQFPLNKRFAEDAVLLAQAIITSQKELLPQRLEDVQTKLIQPKRK